MASIFSRIIQGEIPSYKIAENEEFIAILDAFPLVEGHSLVIPKKEIDLIWDLDKSSYGRLMDFVYDVAQAIGKSVECVRVGEAVIGLEVPHVHVHLVPLNSMEDINFTRPKKQFSPEKMEEIAAKIRGNFSTLS
ncbi:MAG: HIT family protein [Flavobacteriaceae bacterium]|nr:HIT family protein [Flavobacteriaceae bacterium]